MNERTPLINFIIKFRVLWKRQQIRYGAERWSHHSRRPRIVLVVQPNKFPKTAKLTYSGDSPFLLQLVFGVSNEQSSETVLWLMTDFRPLTCEPETGKTTELNVPFRKSFPRRHWSASKSFDAFV